MAERCGFFNATNSSDPDKVYDSSDFAAYFASFIGNGVFAKHSDQLRVAQQYSPDMSVQVLGGQAWINGWWYENTSTLNLDIDPADGTLDRIDIIVVQFDLTNRVIKTIVRKGSPSAGATAPELNRDDDLWELKLAEVDVSHGTVNITDGKITDTRSNTEVCGWVSGLINQMDTTELFNQLKEATQGAVNAMKEALDGTTAGKLQSDVEDLQKTALIDKRGSISDLSIQALLGVDPGSYDVPAAAVNGPDGETGIGNIMLSHCSEDRVSSLLTYDSGNVYAAYGSTADSGANWKRLADWESISQKLLWEGSFNSGSITVPGIKKYRLLSARFRYVQVTFPVLLSRVVPSTNTFCGAVPWFSSTQQLMIFYVQFNLDGDTVSAKNGLISRYYIDPNGWTYGTDSNATIEAITGLI